MKEEKGCGRSRTYDRGPEGGEYREAGSLEQVSIEKAALSRRRVGRDVRGWMQSMMMDDG